MIILKVLEIALVTAILLIKLNLLKKLNQNHFYITIHLSFPQEYD